MHNLLLGIVLGSTLTAGLGIAGTNLYNRDGQVQAPRGSQQQYDYFRQRQLFLDVQKQREQADRDRLNSLTNPCER